MTIEVLEAAIRAPIGAPDAYTMLADGVDHGSVVAFANGSFTYTPDADFCGADTYQYTVSDDRGATDTASVTIEVDCVNDPPVALDDAYTTQEGADLDVAAGARRDGCTTCSSARSRRAEPGSTTTDPRRPTPTP